MDNGVHRFSRNVRKGQRRPVGTDRMTRMAFSPVSAQPSAVATKVENVQWSQVRTEGSPKACPEVSSIRAVKALIMFGVMRRRGEQDE